MDIKSSAFKEGGIIPTKYTCEGDNVNPFLEFASVPQGTKTLALVVDDPDSSHGGVWDHWILWNIPASTRYIEEDTIPHDAVIGKTSFGSNRWGGPCPPEGAKPHRYRFKAYALDTSLELLPETGREGLETAMAGHILAEAKIEAVFMRK
jgi:Raf kinase inhibitor-like YbhB/YbcL family protein